MIAYFGFNSDRKSTSIFTFRKFGHVAKIQKSFETIFVYLLIIKKYFKLSTLEAGGKYFPFHELPARASSNNI